MKFTHEDIDKMFEDALGAVQTQLTRQQNLPDASGLGKLREALKRRSRPSPQVPTAIGANQGISGQSQGGISGTQS